MSARSLSILLVLCMLISTPLTASAQASGPVYIVQAGDSLSIIAGKFNVSMEELMQSNGISDPNQIQAGQELIIPGLEGVSGILDTEVIQFGDSYRSLLRRTQLPEDLFDQLNHLVSPTEFYVGTSMTIPVDQVESGSTSQLSAN